MLRMKGLKYHLNGTINEKIPDKNNFLPSNGGLAWSDGKIIASLVLP